MLCTIAALATGPRLTALRRHLAGGLDFGLSPAAIREILVQAALYTGFSAAEETLARGVPVRSRPPRSKPLFQPDRRRTGRPRSPRSCGS